MTDHPILFNAPMVRALLEGRKTQTRRIAKFVTAAAPGSFNLKGNGGGMCGCLPEQVERWAPDYAPYAIGDRLWVRERIEKANGEAVGYPADGTWLPNTPWLWQRDSLPSIHMPRRLSRLTLTVTAVRVQRLQDISADDAKAEGIHMFADGWHFQPNPEPPYMRLVGIDPVKMYSVLWNYINGPDAWDANPWVTAISFTVEQRNIDA